MEHQNTIPSILGPNSRPGSLEQLPMRRLEPPEKPVAMKLVFWVALGLLTYGAIRFFGR